MKDILDPKQTQVMVDIETLSLEKNAVIVSIGAVKFNIEKGILDTFIINIDPFDCKKLGLHIDPNTIAWWKEQPKEVSDLWKVDPQPLVYALTEFSLWYGSKSLPTWGNSASFDCGRLEEAFKAAGLPIPWVFRDECCYRTVAKLVDIPYVSSEKLHSAIEDAKAQTNHLLKILRS